MLSTWPNLVSRRNLVRQLVASELKSSRAQTRFGWLWWLIDPLLMMLIYWGIMVGLFGRGERYAPYPIYILGTLLAWKHFSKSVTSAVRALRGSAGLIKSVPFPTIVLPVARVLTGFVYFLFGLLLLLAVSALVPLPSHSGSPWPLVQLPLLLACQLAVTLGASLVFACLGAVVLDLQGFVAHVLRIGFYMSPGLYGLDLVREAAHGAPPAWLPAGAGPVLYDLYLLNPFVALFTGYRSALFYGDFMEARLWAVLVTESVALLLLGYLVYQHYDRRVLKFL